VGVKGLDRLIAAASPAWALRREVARTRLEALERARDQVRRFEGADRGRRTQGWFAFDTSAVAATRGALHELRARCRDLRRNNAWASCAVREITNHVVGRGIRPRFTHERDSELRLATELWEEWATTPQADAAGRETFYGLQAAACDGMIDGGESLVRRRMRREGDNLAVPLQVQLLEGDHLDTVKDYEKDAGGNRIVQGIEFDAIGRRRGYWLFRDHPGDSYSSAIFQPSVFVRESEIRHVYRADRIGQVRGIPWAAPVTLRLHDFDAYEDAEQQRLLVATSFAGFVHDLAGADASFADGVAGALTAPGENKNRLQQPIDEIHPGTIEYLKPGKTITFPNPPQNDGFSAFATVQLRAVAKGYGTPYWLLSGDLSGVNFSSIRGDWIAFIRAVDVVRERVVIPHLCEPTMRWWRDAAELADLLSPGFPDPGRLRWEWIPPRREMMDPRTEVTGEVEAVRAGFKSLSQVVSSLGSDPDRVLEALADDLEKAKGLGLTLTTDGANPGPGKTQTASQAAGSSHSPAAGNGANGQDAADDEELGRVLLEKLQARGLSVAEAAATLFGT
jgi:lambda family phage portal protein